jgi:hypothetical protein
MSSAAIVSVLCRNVAAAGTADETVDPDMWNRMCRREKILMVWRAGPFLQEVGNVCVWSTRGSLALVYE